jgi:molybdopterin converting factor small subunit
MKVELRLLGAMKRVLAEGETGGVATVEALDGVTLSGFLEDFGIDASKTLVVLVNGRRPGGDTALHDGDVVSVFPPVAGG